MESLTTPNVHSEEQPSQWLTSEENTAWRTWLAVNKYISTTLADQLSADAHISYPDYEVLVNISEAPQQRIRLAELADALKWDRSRLSHQLKRMEKRGLLAKETCPSDGRGAFAVLAQQGREAIEAAAPDHVREVRRVFIDHLTPEDMERITALGEKILPHQD